MLEKCFNFTLGAMNISLNIALTKISYENGKRMVTHGHPPKLGGKERQSEKQPICVSCLTSFLPLGVTLVLGKTSAYRQEVSTVEYNVGYFWHKTGW